MTPRHVVVLVRSLVAVRAEDALRACVGLTLRGARLTAIVHPLTDVASAAARKGLGTLTSFGHAVVRPVTAADLDDALAEALPSADAVEVWT